MSAIQRPRLLGCGGYLVVGLLVFGFLLATLLGTPADCPRSCGPCDQLIGYTRLPGVTPEEGRKILAYWEGQDCRICGKRRWVTRFEWIRWVVFRF